MEFETGDCKNCEKLVDKLTTIERERAALERERDELLQRVQELEKRLEPIEKCFNYGIAGGSTLGYWQRCGVAINKCMSLKPNVSTDH